MKQIILFGKTHIYGCGSLVRSNSRIVIPVDKIDPLEIDDWDMFYQFMETAIMTGAVVAVNAKNQLSLCC